MSEKEAGERWEVGGPWPGVSVIRCVAGPTEHEPAVYEPVCILDARTTGEPNVKALRDAKAIATLPRLVAALKALLFECETYHIDWARLNSSSPDYDASYKPEFPPCVREAREALKEALP